MILDSACFYSNLLTHPSLKATAQARRSSLPGTGKLFATETDTCATPKLPELPNLPTPLLPQTEDSRFVRVLQKVGAIRSRAMAETRPNSHNELKIPVYDVIAQRILDTPLIIHSAILAHLFEPEDLHSLLVIIAVLTGVRYGVWGGTPTQEAAPPAPLYSIDMETAVKTILGVEGVDGVLVLSRIAQII
ncbi:MAG: hypothetical protein WCA35_01560 [Kovacikia sp.]